MVLFEQFLPENSASVKKLAELKMGAKCKRITSGSLNFKIVLSYGRNWFRSDHNIYLFLTLGAVWFCRGQMDCNTATTVKKGKYYNRITSLI